MPSTVIIIKVQRLIHCSDVLFDSQLGPHFCFALASTEITPPIRVPFPDILPSKLGSAWFYFSHQRLLFFCFSVQINIQPEDVWLFSFIFFLPPWVKIVHEPKNNGNSNAEQTTRGRLFPLALQRCPIVYCLFLISASFFSLFRVILLIIWNIVCEKGKNLKAPSN